jgi:hypothetical protein
VTTPIWQPGTVTTLTDQCKVDGLYPPAVPGDIPAPAPPEASNDVSGVTPLVSGQSFINVVFTSPLSSASWTFIECRVVNTLDSAPLNIWPGIVTSKTASGFSIQLDAIPDSNNYYLEWTVRPTTSVTATTYLLSGPGSGLRGVASAPFTVQFPIGMVAAGRVIVITPSDGGAGGTFTPATVILTDAAPSAAFTYTPSSAGNRTISTTNDSGLTNPTGISFSALSTGYLFSGPSTSTVGAASGQFTVQLFSGGIISGSMTVTPHDGGAGGTFTPSSVMLTTASPSATFTYTAATAGAKTISVTNDSGLTDPANLTLNVYSGTYLFSGPGSGNVSVVSTPFTVQLPAGGAVPGTVIVTPNDGGAGGTFTPTTVPLSTASPSGTFTYTPSATAGVKTISVTNNGGLTDPSSLSYNATSPVHLLNNLISYWKLDELSGTRNDSHGTNHLTDVNSNTSSLAGKINQCAYFVRPIPDNLLQVASNSTLQVTGDFTFSFWYQRNTNNAEGVIAKHTSTAGDYYFYDDGSGNLVLGFTGGPTVSIATPLSVFCHIIGWYDSSDQKVRIRINDTTTVVSTGSGALPTPTTTAFAVGGWATIAQFAGNIDEIGFWKRKLTAAEMTALFNSNNGLPYSSFTT